MLQALLAGEDAHAAGQEALNLMLGRLGVNGCWQKRHSRARALTSEARTTLQQTWSGGAASVHDLTANHVPRPTSPRRPSSPHRPSSRRMNTGGKRAYDKGSNEASTITQYTRSFATARMLRGMFAGDDALVQVCPYSL